MSPGEVAEAMSKTLKRLLACAEELKRSNLSKLSFSKQDWHDAVGAVDVTHDWSAIADARLRDRLRSAGKLVRRLGNSGEARMASFASGRDPDSSSDGKRFHADLETAHALAEDLRRIV